MATSSSSKLWVVAGAILLVAILAFVGTSFAGGDNPTPVGDASNDDDVASSTTQPKISDIYQLGDSYASGEGAPPYDSSSERSGCDRSAAAFVEVASDRIDADAHNVACSGARIDALFDSFKGEKPQVDQIDTSADVVLVMIGGNDIDALSYVVGGKPISTLGPELAALRPRLTDAYRRIAQKVPSADVYAMGYPSIVPATVGPGCAYPQEQFTLFRAATADLNATIATAANAAGIRTILPFSAFDGHELCTAEPWVNPLDFNNPTGSLHPNAQGHQAISREVSATLRQ